MDKEERGPRAELEMRKNDGAERRWQGGRGRGRKSGWTARERIN